MMVLFTAAGIGLGFGSAVYLLLSTERRTWLIGLVLLTTVTNGILFLLNRPSQLAAPFSGAKDHADPLPQALILTAIVIGLAVLAVATLATRKEDQR